MNRELSNIKALVQLRTHEETEAERFWLIAERTCRALEVDLEEARGQVEEARVELIDFQARVDARRERGFSIAAARRQLEDEAALEAEVEAARARSLSVAERLEQAEREAAQLGERYRAAAAALESAAAQQQTIEGGQARRRRLAEEEEVETIWEHRRRSEEP